jgi:hypothetical protein
VSRLFVALYLDEDVDVLIADLLRARDYEVATTVEAGRRGESDAAQLAYAADRGMAILTHNRTDFEALVYTYIATDDHHHGIIIAVRRPAHDVARRLLLLLDQVTADEMRDQVRYI